MNKDSIIDYLIYILLRILGVLIRRVPKGFSLFLGKRLGDLVYCFKLKQKTIAYSNIKTAFGNKLSPRRLRNLTHKFYQAFGQNLIEIFFIPLVDKQYLDKYITFEGLRYIDEAFKNGKGVILLGVHSGSWELSNIICANLGFSFSLFVRNQRYRSLNKVLNLYRTHKGCKLIPRNQTRYLIEALKKNEAIGMTVDQGGKTGMLVKFFGKDASVATGAVRLGLKYNSAILPVFYARLNGPYIKTIIGPPIDIKKTGDTQRDIHDNLQKIISIFEKNIEKYTPDYLWSYKIWKYSRERNILIIGDGKAGHLRQAQAVAKIVSSLLRDRDVTVNIDTAEIKLKNTFAKKALAFTSYLAGRYHCQGCLWCLRTFLQKDDYKSLIGMKPDIIISCGFSVAPINYILSRENIAKSIVIMQPSILSTERFDLAIIPKHDNPPKRKNIVVTEGALNLIDDDYLREQGKKLIENSMNSKQLKNSDFYIGLLIGGDTKDFNLDRDTILQVIKQIKSSSEKLKADILVTTSRRTSKETEEIVKKELKYFPRCKLLVIANEENFPETVGGILNLSQIIITSPESISMVSEAVGSKKYVVVFNDHRLGRKHRRFLKNFEKDKYIHVCQPHTLSYTIEKIWRERPPIYTLKDNFLVKEAIKRIL